MWSDLSQQMNTQSCRPVATSYLNIWRHQATARNKVLALSKVHWQPKIKSKIGGLQQRKFGNLIVSSLWRGWQASPFKFLATPRLQKSSIRASTSRNPTGNKLKPTPLLYEHLTRRWHMDPASRNTTGQVVLGPSPPRVRHSLVGRPFTASEVKDAKISTRN